MEVYFAGDKSPFSFFGLSPSFRATTVSEAILIGVVNFNLSSLFKTSGVYYLFIESYFDK
jgi:hypothetical protein